MNTPAVRAAVILRIGEQLQWRICFVWRPSDAYQVEIVDYH